MAEAFSDGGGTRSTAGGFAVGGLVTEGCWARSVPADASSVRHIKNRLKRPMGCLLSADGCCLDPEMQALRPYYRLYCPLWNPQIIDPRTPSFSSRNRPAGRYFARFLEAAPNFGTRLRCSYTLQCDVKVASS